MSRPDNEATQSERDRCLAIVDAHRDEFDSEHQHVWCRIRNEIANYYRESQHDQDGPAATKLAEACEAILGKFTGPS